MGTLYLMRPDGVSAGEIAEFLHLNQIGIVYDLSVVPLWFGAHPLHSVVSRAGAACWKDTELTEAALRRAEHEGRKPVLRGTQLLLQLASGENVAAMSDLVGMAALAEIGSEAFRAGSRVKWVQLGKEREHA